MAVVAFTRRSAAELRRRLRALAGPEADDVWIGTFHSLCYTCLHRFWAEAGYRDPGILVVDPADRKQIMLEALQATKEKRITFLTSDVDRFGAGLDTAKDRTDSLRAYQQLLIDENSCDYSLLGRQIMELAARNTDVERWLLDRCRFMLVDEVQDSDRTQALFYRTYASRLLVVGDTDQAIYGWRHADPNVVAELAMFDGPLGTGEMCNMRAEVHELTVNCRSGPRIIARANKFRETIKPVLERHRAIEAAREFDDSATMIPDADLDEYLRVAMKQESSTAVLTRTNFIAQQITRRLDAAGIPYTWTTAKEKILEAPGVRETMAYFAWPKLPDCGIIMNRALASEGWGIMKRWKLRENAKRAGASLFETALTMDEKLREFYATLSDEGFIEALTHCAVRVKSQRGGGDIQSFNQLREEAGEFIMDTPARRRSGADFLNWLVAHDPGPTQPRGINVMTVHAAKGLEFDTVLIAGLRREWFPWRGDDATDLEEERRIFYVAMTRARSRLVIVVPPPNEPPSRFIDESMIDHDQPERIKDAV